MTDEIPTTITMPSAYPPVAAGPETAVYLRDAIIALQAAGYLVYEASELPEVTTNGEGRPKLPPRQTWNDTRPAPVRFYEEAFDKLALARWWEQEEERIEKRRLALTADVAAIRAASHYESSDETIASQLVERGWRRG